MLVAECDSVIPAWVIVSEGSGLPLPEANMEMVDVAEWDEGRDGVAVGGGVIVGVRDNVAVSFDRDRGLVAVSVLEGVAVGGGVTVSLNDGDGEPRVGDGPEKVALRGVRDGVTVSTSV